MPAASEARIAANRANALKSTGPQTPEGKDASRANAYKHGLTGAGVVLPEREAAEVERRYAAFCEELQPSGEVGLALAKQAAMLSVRTERCFDQENAALIERVRQAEADFVAPEGCDEAMASKLRHEAGRRAMFDPSKEASLARQYEAAARRGFFRALKELRAVEVAVQESDSATAEAACREALASISRMTKPVAPAAPAKPAEAPPAPHKRFEAASPADPQGFLGRVDVPISIGKRC